MGEVFKPLLLDVDPILTREEIYECEVAVATTVLGALLPSTDVRQGYRGIDDRRTRLVRNRAGDRAVRGLRVQVQGWHQQENDD
jgi:hypothetical protein